ncbi:acetyltransferase [Colletotrichum lupini]|uniref:Acetyltransferase n=1 Tax=Colletotrichum lupini TaxID=145971 RepID=A0A9Q8T3Q7_9PEZI|nr:acetyltransferase [Colletotrichum lupini]UQC88636.1 acetyltransferase [Colletotrichum lupini]
MSADGKNAFLVVETRDTDELIGYGGYNTSESVDPPEFLDQTTLQGSKAYREAKPSSSSPPKTSLDVKFSETGDDNEPWRALMRAAGLAKFEGWQKASYDEKQEVWVWKFDAGHWKQEKERMQIEGK